MTKNNILKTNSNYLEVNDKKEVLEKRLKLALSDYFKTTNYSLEIINEIRNFVSLDNISKIENNRFAVTISFAVGPL